MLFFLVGDMVAAVAFEVNYMTYMNRGGGARMHGLGN
jgi:hypothetical protein